MPNYVRLDQFLCRDSDLVCTVQWNQQLKAKITIKDEIIAIMSDNDDDCIVAKYPA